MVRLINRHIEADPDCFHIWLQNPTSFDNLVVTWRTLLLHTLVGFHVSTSLGGNGILSSILLIVNVDIRIVHVDILRHGTHITSKCKN